MTTATATAARATPASAQPRKRREPLRNLAFLSPWLLGTGLFFLYPLVSTVVPLLHPLRRLQPRRPGSAWTTGRTCFRDYPFFWPALRNTLWFVVVMVTLRIVFGLGVGMLVIQRQARRRAVPHHLLRAVPRPAGGRARSRSSSCSTPAPARSNSILGKLGLPQPGWFNDPAWSKPALTLLARVGRRRPDGHLHGRAARRAAGAVRGGRARRSRRDPAVPPRHAAHTCGRSWCSR